MRKDIRRRYGFGGPWMRGRKIGQLSIFMIWDEEWVDGEVIYAWVTFNSRDWISV